MAKEPASRGAHEPLARTSYQARATPEDRALKRPRCLPEAHPQSVPGRRCRVSIQKPSGNSIVSVAVSTTTQGNHPTTCVVPAACTILHWHNDKSGSGTPNILKYMVGFELLVPDRCGTKTWFVLPECHELLAGLSSILVREHRY